jgi:CRP-like cAMP-binding protein
MAELIASVELFKGFSKKDLKLLHAQLKEDWFNAGDDIISAEDEPGRFYIVTEGRASVVVDGEVVRTLGPGDYFGEMALLDNAPRSATVRAETQVKTQWLSRMQFLSLLEENWSMAKVVLADLCARIRRYDRAHASLQ